MRVGRQDLVRDFFRHLEARGITYAVLESDDQSAADATRIRYVVGNRDLPKIDLVVAAVAARHGWWIAQRLQADLFSRRTTLIDPDDISSPIVLVASSHYASGHCLLVRDAVLLHQRIRDAHGFLAASTPSQFIYTLAGVLQDATEPIADHFPRLHSLWSADPAGAQRRFDELVGATGRTVPEWLAQPPAAWLPLRESMRTRTGYAPALRVADTLRMARRLLQPAGLQITVLGPDGAGKSTLIENLRRRVQPVLDGWLVLQFRPDVFNRIVVKINPDPHGKPPRSAIVSWAKITYYFVDHWLGWLFIVLPARARNSAVIFDRDFDDLAVDQRRYLVQGSGALVKVLRRLLPRAAATFILHGDARAIHARKPEFPLRKLEDLQAAYRSLAGTTRRYRLVSVDHPPEEIADIVARDIIGLLACRSAPRVPVATRVFNIAIAVPAVVLLSPVLAIVAGLVRFRLGRPVLFRQERPGFGGRLFTLYKFRTMRDALDATGMRLSDADRLTPFGSFLRSTSLDELPELFNVVRGEMSVVGPRPLLPEYLDRYTPEQTRRHDVPPGITGWAQINGRNAARWPDRFALDIWYVDNRSMALDLKIMVLTVVRVLRREGISQPGRATVDKFYGNEEPTPLVDQPRP